MNETIETKYVCVNCGAEDSDRSTSPPQVLNCWSCGAGRKNTIGEQLGMGIGMLPEAVAEVAKAVRR